MGMPHLPLLATHTKLTALNTSGNYYTCVYDHNSVIQDEQKEYLIFSKNSCMYIGIDIFIKKCILRIKSMLATQEISYNFKFKKDLFSHFSELKIRVRLKYEALFFIQMQTGLDPIYPTGSKEWS